MLLFQNKQKELIQELKRNLLFAKYRSSFENAQFDAQLSNKYYMLTEIEEAQSIAFSNFQKLILQVSISQAWTLENEVNVITQYIELWHLLDSKSPKPKFEIKTIDKEIVFQPLILLPIIQNAFHHGYNSMINYPIKIKLNVSEQNVSLTVSNHVNHYLENQAQTRIMDNLKGRLMYHYPDKHQILTNSNSLLFKVNLILPLIP